MGKIAGDVVPEMSRPAPALIRVDARDGFAHPAYEAGEDALIDAAKTQGIALMGITNAYACGVLGYFTGRLARRGLVGVMMANASSTMAPWGGSDTVFRHQSLVLCRPAQGRAAADRQFLFRDGLCEPRQCRRRRQVNPAGLGA